jgi:TolB-like protein
LNAPSGATQSSRPIDSIAVLPFTNAGNDPETDYLCDGITESIMNSLSRIAQLRVTPRSTVFRYKARDSDRQLLGRETGVAEGRSETSVLQRSSGELREQGSGYARAVRHSVKKG